jgi:peptidoglycan-N-acetylglucosamine deacetylase
VRRGLAFVTYRDMLDLSDPRAGLSLAFDDDAIDAWSTLRETLAAHDARVTFFVTRYHAQSAEARAQLAALAADGHDIEAHGVDHLDATAYVAAHGMEAYLRDEALPSIDQLVADGYPASVFAYPFGVHDDAIDRALLDHVALVRTTAGPCPW